MERKLACKRDTKGTTVLSLELTAIPQAMPLTESTSLTCSSHLQLIGLASSGAESRQNLFIRSKIVQIMCSMLLGRLFTHLSLLMLMVEEPLRYHVKYSHSLVHSNNKEFVITIAVEPDRRHRSSHCKGGRLS